MKAYFSWLFYALVTTFTWGIWGALMKYLKMQGFPNFRLYRVVVNNDSLCVNCFVFN